jgi:hypothetical protein
MLMSKFLLMILFFDFSIEDKHYSPNRKGLDVHQAKFAVKKY